MPNSQHATLIHADDYGITVEQARRILFLSSSSKRRGALNSLSVFVNSPAFSDASELVKPYLEQNDMQVRLHLNLVEGAPACNPSNIPLLVNERGMFRNNFLGLLMLSLGTKRKELFNQLTSECREQIRRFTAQFPSQKSHLRLDSHQHTHAIPLVYKALAKALQEEGCAVSLLREPIDPLFLYRPSRMVAHTSTQTPKNDEKYDKLPKPHLVNKLKVLLIDSLWKRCPKDALPWAESAPHQMPLFCGVALSGQMDEFNEVLLRSFKEEAERQQRDLEILFHPISVPVEQCLDPLNKPFSEACAGPSRQKEAKRIESMKAWNFFLA